MLGKLKIKQGEPVTIDALNAGMVNLVATNNFEAVRYQLDKVEDGYILEMEIQESQGRAFIKLGAHYDDLYRSAVLVNLSKKKFVKIEVNRNTRLKSLPLDRNLFFLFGFMTLDEKIVFIDQLAAMIMQKSNVIVYVDEAHEILNERGNYSRELESLIAGARAKAIHVILVTQRPQSIRKSVINNCKYRLCFKMTEANSVRAMSQHLEKVSEDDIRNLKLFEFWIYNSYTGSIHKSRIIF